jgi:predicted  nucleic acid-binding Zn-ribbon protein
MADGGLAELHALRLRLEEVQHRLDLGPRQIRSREQVVEKRNAELAKLKDEVVQAKLAADRKSLQLRTHEAKLAELQAKLNAASSNREFDIIRGQIDADSMAKSVLEDEILEALEKIDQAQSAVRDMQAKVEAAKAEVVAGAAGIKADEPGLRDEAGTLSARIAALENEIVPAAIREPYKRLVQAHGAAALASVEKGVCTGCYVKVLPQSLVEVNSGKAIFCKSCGKLLYPAPTE